MEQTPYPVQFSVDYPDRLLDRLTTFFRLFVAVPNSRRRAWPATSSTLPH